MTFRRPSSPPHPSEEIRAFVSLCGLDAYFLSGNGDTSEQFPNGAWNVSFNTYNASIDMNATLEEWQAFVAHHRAGNK